MGKETLDRDIVLYIFFHFDVYMIENKPLLEGGTSSFHYIDDLKKIFADWLKTTQPCGNIGSAYTCLLRVKYQSMSEVTEAICKINNLF